MAVVEFLFRWAHVLFGITWIGMLYYFNFVQTEYFKEAEAEGLKDAKAKLAPRALWWFRWGAMFTFITGVLLLGMVGAFQYFTAMPVIWVGALAGTFMFLNVWLIIWPAQQVVLGLNGKTGDGPASAARAGLASRTNTLLSAPMLFCMLGAKHLAVADPGGVGFWAAIGVVVAVEANALFGKMGPMASVKGVIHCSLALTAIIWALLHFL